MPVIYLMMYLHIAIKNRGKEFPVDQLPDKLKLSLESKKLSNLLKKRLKNG